MAAGVGDLALLGDCRTAALVTLDGAVEWWPGPRFDGPSVFRRLLDPDAGHFTVRPAGRCSSRRAYLDGTLVLETSHDTGAGVLRVTDALAFAPGARGHQIGMASPDALVRVVEAVGGDVEIAVELVPRPEYGMAAPPEPLDPEVTLADTIEAWRSWTAMHEGFEGPYRDTVLHSTRVIQGLTYQPTGAVLAAPTTSLPEVPGGDQNWDYRYAWLRDASLIARALLAATCADEAQRYFGWMTRAAVSCRESAHVQIVFGAGGEPRGNMPQALSHVGLIYAARILAEAEDRVPA